MLIQHHFENEKGKYSYPSNVVSPLQLHDFEIIDLCISCSDDEDTHLNVDVQGIGESIEVFLELDHQVNIQNEEMELDIDDVVVH